MEIGSLFMLYEASPLGLESLDSLLFDILLSLSLPLNLELFNSLTFCARIYLWIYYK